MSNWFEAWRSLLSQFEASASNPTAVQIDRLRPKLDNSARPRGAYFCWEAPNEGVTVRFHFSVVQLLERDVIRARDKSAAGVLLGRMERGRHATLTVEGYEAATPEWGAPESPFKDPRAVDSITSRWRLGQKRMATVGFYRTSGREGATLDKDDLAALCTSAIETSTDSCVNHAQLKDLTYNAKHCQPLPDSALERKVNASIKVPAPSAQDAELALKSHLGESERIFLLIEPSAGRAGDASLYLARGTTILCQSCRMPFSGRELSDKEVMRRPDLSFSAQDLPSPPQSQQDLREQTENNSRTPPGWRWLVIAVAATAILSVGFFQVRGQQMLLYSSPSDRENPNDSRLGLKLERRGTDWELSWNQNTQVMLQARKALVRITDGFIQKNIELNPAELRSGTILYAPITEEIVVQLEVERNGSADWVSESVRIVAGVLPPFSGPRTDTTNSSRNIRNQLPRLNRSPATRAQSTAASGKASAAISPSESKVVAEVADSPTLKSTMSNGAIKNQAKPADELPELSLPSEFGAFQGPRSELLSTLILAPRPMRNGGELEPAQLISRRDPVYPADAKQRKISGTVEVHFKIGADGEVREVTATKGTPALAQAAVEAVREWRYKPARLDGVPAEIQAKTTVVFELIK